MNVGTRDRLLDEIDEYQWSCKPFEERVSLKKMEDFFVGRKIEFEDQAGHERLLQEFDCENKNAPLILEKLLEFIHLTPQLPQAGRFVHVEPIELAPAMSRNEVVEYLSGMRNRSEVANLAFYAYRDLGCTDWAPFAKAAFERNPVCLEAVADWADDRLVAALHDLPHESIYDGSRAAQPDEVWNYGRGDGLEKAFLLAAVWKSRNPDIGVRVEADGQTARCIMADRHVDFPGCKGLIGRVDG